MVQPTYKIIDGKRFKMWNSYPSKRTAQNAKAKLKKQGKKVRVFATKRRGTSIIDWWVYFRPYR